MTTVVKPVTSTEYPLGGFTSVFYGDEAFLSDHVIQGKKLLPATAYLELARAAVAMAVPTPPTQAASFIQLSESFFIQPLVVDGPTEVTVNVYPGSAGQFGVEVSTVSGVHFQAKVTVLDDVGSIDNLDLPVLGALCQTQGPTPQAFYQQFASKGVDFGVSHQGVVDIKIGQQGEKPCALAKVALPGSSGNGMVMDPGMLDSFLQSSDVLWPDPQVSRIPFAIGQLTVLGPLTDQMVGFVLKTDKGFDISIADEHGVVKVLIKDFQGRELEKQDQLLFYRPTFELDELSSAEEGNTDVSRIKAQGSYQDLVKAVFHQAKSLIDNKTQGHTLEVQLSAEQSSMLGILAGLKTINQEQSNIDYRLIYDGKVVSSSYQPVVLAQLDNQHWADNQTILISGGLGGLGKIFAEDIAKNSHGNTLILVGRSELNEQKQAFIGKLESYGCKVDYACCDIANGEAVNALVADYPHLNGIIHGSGINRDNYLHNKTDDEIEQVLAAKVQGLINLDAASAGLNLAYFVTLSSVAGTLGNSGQYDYSAANGFMDSFMQARSAQVIAGQRQGKSISINWPLWQSDGMQVDAATRAQLERKFKIKLLSVEHGLDALKRIIQSDESNLLVAYGSQKAIDGMLARAVKTTEVAAQSSSLSSSLSSSQSTQAATPEVNNQLAKAVMAAVKQQTSEFIALPIDVLDAQEDWANFGFDSILLSGLGEQINTAFGLDLMPTVFFEATCIELLCEYLLEHHREQMSKALNIKVEKAAVPVPVNDHVTPAETVPSTVPDTVATSGASKQSLDKAVLNAVKAQTSDFIALPVDVLDESDDWANFGFDSILLSGLAEQLNGHFDVDLMPTAFFEATNINLLTEFLVANYGEHLAAKLGIKAGAEPAQASVHTPLEPPQSQPISLQPTPDVSAFSRSFQKAYKSNVAYREEDIAIIGIDCTIAGANNLNEFWQVLAEDKDMISEIPAKRWDHQAYPESRKWGSFIDGVDEFDSLFFGISPAEAVYMTPEQRLLLQSVWHCLEDAGLGGEQTRGSNTSIFVGCGPSNYTKLLNDKPVEAYSATGFVPSVGPNRISYLMDWHGASQPIDTACSSALVAIHRALESIRKGDSEQALAGGVNLLLTPDSFISFTKAGMLCEDGRCKTFSDRANGYVRGEGIGMLMLKPLKAAIADGHQIYALIKGSAENHGGRTNSLTAPNPKSQAAVIKKAVEDAGVDFARISYVECHGTGTELGDPVEVTGLSTVAKQMLDGKAVNHVCKLGSIKSNIGHLEFAAGVAGVIKVILQMKHQKIAKSLHCESLNPYIKLQGTPFEVAQQQSDWTVPAGQTRIAGVSSFGFGGVNAHVILEEFNPSQLPESFITGEGKAQLLTLSAKNEQALYDYVAQFPAYLQSLDGTQTTLKDVAYTLQTGRQEMPERLVFIATTIDEFASQVDAYLQNKGQTNHDNICRGSVKGAVDSLQIEQSDAGKNYIRQLMQTNEAKELAQLWVRGSKLNWQELHV